jgi:hypothetical protein
MGLSGSLQKTVSLKPFVFVLHFLPVIFPHITPSVVLNRNILPDSPNVLPFFEKLNRELAIEDISK